MVQQTASHGDPILATIWPTLTMPSRSRTRNHSLKLHLGPSYIAIPDMASPRYIVPADRALAARIVRNFGASGTRRDSVRNRAMQLILRSVGQIPFHSEMLLVEGANGPHGTIEDHLSRTLGQPVSIGVHLGPPRANRKPVIQVVDKQGHVIAFAKLGINETTRRLVRREGKALTQLQRAELGQVQVPRVLHRGVWSGCELLVLAPLPVPPRRRAVSSTLLNQAMSTVALSGGTRTLSIGESSYVEALVQSARMIGDASLGNQLMDRLTELRSVDHEIPFGSWHGDWTVWNMAQRDKSLLVWDWERFASNVPVGFDALHYALGAMLRRSGPTKQTTRQLIHEAPGLLAQYGLSKTCAEAVASLYLVDLALRYTHDDQRAAGGQNAFVEDWIAPVLAEPSRDARTLEGSGREGRRPRRPGRVTTRERDENAQ